MENNLSAAQTKALESLRSQQADGWKNRNKYGDIATGCNTTTLRNLRTAGLITASRLFLNGAVSSDIKVN